MSCGIMRVEKRNRQALYGLKIEACRSRKDHMAGRDFMKSDIDWTRTDFNTYLVKTDNWMEKIDTLTAGLRKRKDSVLLLDGIYTASPDFFKELSDFEMKEYFEDCLQFHIKEYCSGNKDLVVSAVIHFDETTPHLHVASVPIIEKDDGTKSLSAKAIMGNATQYRQRQDRFFEEVTSEYNLERGEKSDAIEKRKHLQKLDFAIAEKQKELQQIEQASEDYVLLEDNARQRAEQAEHALEKAEKKRKAIEADIEAKEQEYNRMYTKVYNAQRIYGTSDYEKQLMMDKIKELQDELRPYRKEARKNTSRTGRDARTSGREEIPRRPVKTNDFDR